MGRVNLPDCVCGGQPVVFDRNGVCVVMCGDCKQFVTEYSKDLAVEEWRMRIHAQRQRHDKKK